MESNCYVYLYRRKDNGDVFYIGKGVGKRAEKVSAHNKHCQSIINKYGFYIDYVRNNITSSFACELEKKLINYYVYYLGYSLDVAGFNNNVNHHLCNATFGGEGMFGYSPSKQTKEKISKAKIGDKNPTKRIDVKEKLSNNHRMKIEDNRILQSKKMLEYYRSEDGIAMKEHLSQTRKDFYQTEDGRKQRQESSDRMKDFFNSEESTELKEKMLIGGKKFKQTDAWKVQNLQHSVKMKEYWSSDNGKIKRKEINEKMSGFNNPRSINILCIETNYIYSSTSELAKTLNITYEKLRSLFRFHSDENGMIELFVENKLLHFIKIKK